MSLCFDLPKSKRTVFGELFLKFRVKRKLRILDIAQCLEIKCSEVSDLEFGRIKVTKEIITKLARLMDLSLEQHRELSKAAGIKGLL